MTLVIPYQCQAGFVNLWESPRKQRDVEKMDVSDDIVLTSEPLNFYVENDLSEYSTGILQKEERNAEEKKEGLGRIRPVSDLLTSMADETGGMDGAPFIKTEIPSLLPSRPPGLLPIPGRAPGGLPGLLGQAEDGKHSVQAAMAMAAFYQSPLFVQAAMARERERLQQQHATLPHPAAAVAALSQLPGRGPAGGIQGIPGHPFNLAGMLSAHATTNQLPGLPGLPGAASILEQSRQDLLRDYLTKLAQSTLNVTTSMGAAPPAPSPQYLQSTSVADIKTEKLVPTSLRRSSSPGSTTNDNITSTVSMLERQGIRQRSPPPPAGLSSSLQQSLNYLQRERDHANAYFPPTSLPNHGGYFGLQRHTSPDTGGNGVMPMSTTGPIKRSPPSTGRRNGSANGREKVFTCNVCNRSFGYKHVLQNHERTHTGEKPFECKECHKRFTRDHHLKTHMRLHTGEKPYSCTHCDRQFVQVANLRRHLRVHTGERPYKCELCPSNFSDSNQMKAHMLTHKGPSFGSLKDELFFRHSWQQAQQGGASFPLPQYPPAPILGSNTSLSELNQSSLTVVKAEADNSSQASMSPDSKETTGSGDSPSHGENLSDSNSEKRRSRKQKPRKMISHYEEGEGNGTSEDTSPRDRNVSSSSYSQSQTGGHSMQQEPEDLSVRPSNQDVRQMELERQMDLFRQSQVISSKETGIQQSGLRNRSEGSDGSLSISDDGPTSIHSTPKDKYRGADDEDMDDKEVDDDERGVSPPSSLGSHGGPYGSALFGGPHRIHSGGVMPIQLGLSGAALPLSREYMEKEKEILTMVAKQQHEISQQ